MQLVAKDIEQVMLLLLALLTLAAGQTGVAAEVASGGLGRAPVARVPAAVTNFTQKRSVAAVRPTPTRVPRPAPRPVVQPKSPVPRAKPATVKRSGPSKHVSSSSAADEVATLLAIKRVLDPTGTTLTDWQPGSSTACEWLPVKIPPAIQCNPSNRVTEISIMGLDGASPLKLTGRLPSSALLRRLPFLERIQIFQTTLRGPLPPDWSLLKQLRQIELMYNALTGTLPPSWGAMTKLQVLELSSNKLRGPLPPAWSNMAGLTVLGLDSNGFVSTVPPSWGSWKNISNVRLSDNPGLTGCMPRAWKRQVGDPKVDYLDKYFDKEVMQAISSEDVIQSGTRMTGYC